MSIPLRILRAMYRDTEYTVGDLAEMIRVDAPAVERALALMVARGLVRPIHGGKYRKGAM